MKKIQMILIRQRGSLEQFCECRLSSPSLLAGKFEKKCTAFPLAAISVKEEEEKKKQIKRGSFKVSSKSFQ